MGTIECNIERIDSLVIILPDRSHRYVILGKSRFQIPIQIFNDLKCDIKTVVQTILHDFEFHE
jgi:hypothetical protein